MPEVNPLRFSFHFLVNLFLYVVIVLVMLNKLDGTYKDKVLPPMPLCCLLGDMNGVWPIKSIAKSLS